MIAEVTGPAWTLADEAARDVILLGRKWTLQLAEVGELQLVVPEYVDNLKRNSISMTLRAPADRNLLHSVPSRGYTQNLPTSTG